jgi:dihydroorotate dehydrogenase electron transfer subunit
VTEKADPKTQESSRWFQETAKILRHDPLGPGLLRLTLHAPDIAAGASPGQFVNLRVSERIVPLLRRPFSLAGFDRDGGTVTIIYQVVGEGTRLLSECRPGQTLSLLGPLGRGFPLEGSSPLILVGGGVGAAPLIAAAQAACRSGRSVSALIGARTAEALIGEDAMVKAGVKVQVCTDDGSRGIKGFPTDLLDEAIRANDGIRAGSYTRAGDVTRVNDPIRAGDATRVNDPIRAGDAIRGIARVAPQNLPEILACGPAPMLKVVQDIARRTETPAYISLETIMACGVGACLGCSCRLKSGCREIFGKVCTDGPVFNAREVAL